MNDPQAQWFYPIFHQTFSELVQDYETGGQVR